MPHRPQPCEDSTDINSELQTLLADLQREKQKHYELKHHQQRLSDEEADLSKIEAQLQSLNQVLSSHSIDCLSGTLTSLNSQIDALKLIVNDTLDASSNAFAFDDGEIPKDSHDYSMAVDIDPSEFPMDSNVMSRLLELEMKSCVAIGKLSDIKSLL